MPWSLPVPPQSKGARQVKRVLPVSRGVRKLSRDIKGETSQNQKRCSHYEKFLLEPRPSDLELEQISPLPSRSILESSTSLINCLNEPLKGTLESPPVEERPGQEDELSGSDRSTDRISDVGEDEHQPAKRVRTQLDVSRFPWNQQRESRVASLPEDIKSTFEKIELYSRDPKQVVEHILSTPGCPPFPPAQWINMVQWKYVDLAKVLESAHTTELLI
ncbi:hypothetical protein EDD15DRAFT_2204302 [Pisolithus albus]|nr:hypothetical protein EDD15DRAFT_2204302 [Pisolithus albus]